MRCRRVSSAFSRRPECPTPLTRQLNAAFVKAIEAPAVRKTLEASGFEVVTSTSAEFGAVIKAALDRYRRIAADARLEPQ